MANFREFTEPDVRRRWQNSPQEAVGGPAKALLITAVLGLFTALVQYGMAVYGRLSYSGPARMQPPEEVVMEAAYMAQATTQMAAMIVAIWGAVKMQRLESYGLALSASILLMLPWTSPCCILGLPFGIWAASVLSRPGIRESFRS